MEEHREHGLHMRNAKQYLIPTHSTKSRTTELHGGPVNCLSDIHTVYLHSTLCFPVLIYPQHISWIHLPGWVSVPLLCLPES
jgi:hypothetical protein